MTQRIFITATDTGAGKTHLTALLTEALLAHGINVRALKPVATGTPAGHINDDVERLMQAQGIGDPSLVNRYSFALAAAPSLAAAAEGREIDPRQLVDWCDAQSTAQELMLIEGVGGVMVPLAERWLVSDWLAAMPDAAVVLVVGCRLGCTNHALLSLRALEAIGRVPDIVVLNDLGSNEAVRQAHDALTPLLPDRCRMAVLPHGAGNNSIYIMDIFRAFPIMVDRFAAWSRHEDTDHR